MFRLAADQRITERFRPQAEHGALQCRPRQRSLYTCWQMSSYTALSSLSLQDAPELPQDKADEQLPPITGEPEQLPKGAHTGNVLHALLENLDFVVIAAGENISVKRDLACLQYGLKLERPELIDNLLQTVVATPLSDDKDFCPQLIPGRRCMKEMAFYLSVQAMDAARINRILQLCPAYQPLGSRQMSGYLTGFIDLSCQYRGRFYLIDYKSNSLADYRTESLLRAMREHNHGLQYWIDTLVLHGYLKHRLPDYDYETISAA